MSSLFDQRASYSAQFNFHQVDYHKRQQTIKAQDSSQTRWVVQPHQTNEQAVYGELLATNIFHSAEVLHQLSFGIGPGVGTSFPTPQAGSTVTVINVGNQKYVLGAQRLAPRADFIHTLTRSKKYPGLALPSSLAPTVKNAGGYVSATAICSQPKSDLVSLSPTEKLNAILLPAAVSSTHPKTSAVSKIIPVEESKIAQSFNSYSLCPLVSLPAEYLNSRQLEDSAKFLAEAEAEQLHESSTITKEVTKISVESPTRANTFKLEVLRSIQASAQEAYGIELGARASYPALYALSNSAWADSRLKEAFQLIQKIEQDPTYIKVKEINDKLNRYLPIAKKVTNILFPPKSEDLTVDTFGVTADLNNLVITPNYQPEILRLNKFLPTNLQLSLNAEASELVLGLFTTNLFTPFEFTSEFKDYVNQVNSYLPADLDWKFGIGTPATALFICKGVVISNTLGLLISNQALDANKILEQNLNCAAKDTVLASEDLQDEQLPTVDEQVREVTPLGQQIRDLSAAYLPNLFAGIPGLFGEVNGSNVVGEESNLTKKATSDLEKDVAVNNDVAANLQSKVLNTALPSGLQFDLQRTVDNVKQINLGPIQATRTSATSWTLEIPGPTKLLGGLDILDTLGVIPPSLKFLREALPQLASVYAEHPAEFLDLLGEDNVIDRALNSTLAKFKLDYSTGIKIEQLPPDPLPEEFIGPVWNSLEDVQQTIASTPGFLDDLKVQNFTQRPTLQGSFLPLLNYAAQQLVTQATTPTANDSSVRLGRSTSGVSLRTGTVPTLSGVNYTLLASLCADSSDLFPARSEPFAVKALEKLPLVVSGFEYTEDTAATPLEIQVDDTIDPQSSRQVLEAQLIETGLGDLASETLNALDLFLYPDTTTFDIYQVDNEDELQYGVINLDIELQQPTSPGERQVDVLLVPNLADEIERQLEPISPDLEPSVIDFLNVIQTIGNLATDQVLSGLVVAAVPEADPVLAVEAVTAKRFNYLLDCQALTTFGSSLNQLKRDKDFVSYAREYGVPVSPALTYITDPAKVLDIVDQTEPRLSPAVERLLIGDMLGFFQQLIWAKTKVDVYNSPLAYLALATNVRSYYGGAVPSSRPAREWMKEISK